MKLAENALLEVVEILRKGLSEGTDVSEMLRELDLQVEKAKGESLLKLSDKYLAARGRVL